MNLHKDIQTVKIVGLIIVFVVIVKLCTIFTLSRKGKYIEEFLSIYMATLARGNIQSPSLCDLTKQLTLP